MTTKRPDPVFIKELKKKGGYLYGSRALGTSTEKSDYDWALLLTSNNMGFLRAHGFRKDNSYSRNSRRFAAIYQLPGLQSETLESWRKGNTNVVLMSPRLLAANKYATDMLKLYEGKGIVSTKEGRVQGYQRFGTEWARLNPCLGFVYHIAGRTSCKEFDRQDRIHRLKNSLINPTPEVPF